MSKAHPKDITFRQCKYFDVDLFNDDMGNINWERLLLIPTVNDAWDFFYSEVMNVINKHAPLKTVRVKGTSLPWINSELISLFKRRDVAWAKFRLTRNQSDWEIYRQLRNSSKTKTRNAKSEYYKN